ncbi:gamma-glutamyl kinase [Candidatus Thiomargarita nelsonii]|uniref:Glutamate 5-kinase n=1 Tax=Candidatus Thiomargarita nelsonii TaxID=1003181 RepID=A0A0A6PEQ8_9GAMM|nr:gamma-glutamyl kinase [Candidatus Thiomargarita nelsonii]
MNKRKKLGKRWVIKIGSALLTNDGRGLDKTAIKNWVAQMAALTDIEIVLVSSGAVAEGMTRLNWTQRPTALYQLQAAAALGQMGMIQTYESFFQEHGLHTAQILLTHDDLVNRQRYLNARSTLRTLVNLEIVPVVNENDTVTTEEIRFGDNDTLAALVANLIEADLLVILTDQQGLYERDPRIDPSAKLIQEAYAGEPSLEAMAGDTGGHLGRGGMLTKIRAATLAARSGTATIIASGRVSDVLLRIKKGENIGTLLRPAQAPLAARKQWLASHLKMRGRLYLDEGAERVLRHSGKSLLAIGVTRAEGQFARGDMVACISPDGKEVARGLVNYNAEETHKILGQPSHKIETLLGYVDEPELIHRDNLVLV